MDSKVRTAGEVKPGPVRPASGRGAAATVVAPRIQWFNEPAVVLIAYGLLGLLVRFATASPWRAWLAGLLALFGAGFSLTAALYPRRAALDLVERLALSGLLSLAVGGITGFALIQLPWGLTLTSSLLALSLLNAACYLVVIYRRRNLAAFEQPFLTPGRGVLSGWLRRQNSAGMVVALLLLVALVAGAGALQRAARAPIADPAMTEFYLLDANGQVEDLPTTATAGEVFTLDFGVDNRTPAAAGYQVLALVKEQLVGDSGAFRLEPNREARSSLGVTVPAGAKGQTRIDVILFRDGKRDRDLYLWVTVEPVGK